jgi:hypothetical protein
LSARLALRASLVSKAAFCGRELVRITLLY